MLYVTFGTHSVTMNKKQRGKNEKSLKISELQIRWLFQVETSDMSSAKSFKKAYVVMNSAKSNLNFGYLK